MVEVTGDRDMWKPQSTRESDASHFFRPRALHASPRRPNRVR